MASKVNKPSEKIAAGWEAAKKSNFSDKDVDVIGPALVEMHNQGVDINIDNVIKAAKKKDSPLHPYLYEVSNEQMLREWRRRKAGDIIRSVCIVWKYTDTHGDEKADRTRAFVKVTKKSADDLKYDGTKKQVKDGIYVPIVEVADTPEYLAEVIGNMVKDLANLDRKYRFYKDRLPKMKNAMAKAYQDMVDKYLEEDEEESNGEDMDDDN